MSKPYEIKFIDKSCLKEYQSLRGNKKELVNKGLARLRMRAKELGKPLSGSLQGCKELKFRSDGIRIIFRIVGSEIEIVEIIAIGKRDKERVFSTAVRRIQR